MSRVVLPTIVCVVLSAIAGEQLQAAYLITDLGTLPGGTITYARGGLNDWGQVTGDADAGGGDIRAYLYDSPTITDLGTLGGRNSYGRDINNARHVVGYAHTSAGRYHAFLYDGGTMLDLGTLGTHPTDQSKAWGINDSGQVTGESSLNGPYHAFIYDGGTMTDLGTLVGAGSSFGRDINNLGQVTGYANVFSGNKAYNHAFLYDGTNMLDLGTLGGDNSLGREINDTGWVTGRSDTVPGDPDTWHAFLYNGTGMTDLGTFGGNQSIGLDINDAGDVVGYAETDSQTFRAFLYADGTMHDLNDLIPADSGWYSLSAAWGINDSGQIMGYGNHDGAGRAFLLTPDAAPVPEPASLVLWGGLSTFALGFALRRRRNRAVS